MKLSKQQVKLHKQAEEYLLKDELSFDEKIFVLENWNEGAENMNGFAGAFFTPIGLAKDFSLCLYENGSIIDLCAGIGMLSFFAYHWKQCQVTCVELNPDYVRVGKKILPEATWINCSVTDSQLLELPRFDQAISNPPFGKIKSGLESSKRNYHGSEFEYITIDVASQLAGVGSFILPQMSTPFKYSGNSHFEKREPTSQLSKFLKETGFEMQLALSVDTEYYLEDWKGVKPLCEIVEIDFENTAEIIDELKEEANLFNYAAGEWGK